MNHALIHVYYRAVKNGTRTFASIPANVQTEVRAWADAALENGSLSQDDYDRMFSDA